MDMMLNIWIESTGGTLQKEDAFLLKAVGYETSDSASH